VPSDIPGALYRFSSGRLAGILAAARFTDSPVYVRGRERDAARRAKSACIVIHDLRTR